MAKQGEIPGVIGFLGAGQMARALAGGFVQAGLAPAERIVAFDPSEAAIEGFRGSVGEPARGLPSAAALAEEAETIFLAVKPIHAPAALASASEGWAPSKLLVSIAAGLTIEKIESALPSGAAVVRVMPNTPCLIGHGACCYSAGEHATKEQAERVGKLLSSVGFAEQTPEASLDAVTGLSGSGPAFVYTAIEALADGGVRAGLPRVLAARLAAQTVAGAAQMVLATGEHPAALRDAVASPGGTTITGLAELERRGLRAALIEAVVAAKERSAELGCSD